MIHEQIYWRTTDDTGTEMPWYTRPVCAWLDTLDFNGKEVWEYGGGQSTHWFRGKGAIVNGVDDQEKWATMAGLKYADGYLNYLKAINDFADFDFICIDGIYRDECIRYALQHLKPNGYIIIDNWKDEVCPDWPETDAFIEEYKLILRVFRQEDHPTWATAIITR